MESNYELQAPYFRERSGRQIVGLEGASGPADVTVSWAFDEHGTSMESGCDHCRRTASILWYHRKSPRGLDRTAPKGGLISVSEAPNRRRALLMGANQMADRNRATAGRKGVAVSRGFYGEAGSLRLSLGAWSAKQIKQAQESAAGAKRSIT